MISSQFLLASALCLAGSLRASAAFLGCCDDPPDPPQPPPPQNVTNVQVHVDIPDIVSKMKPGTKVIVKVDSKLLTANSNLNTQGLEVLKARVEVSGGFTFVCLQKLLGILRRFGLASGRGPGGGGESVSPPGGGASGGPVAQPSSPVPRPAYRHWIGPEITTVPFSPQVIQTIESDGTPIRFGFSVPFGTASEFFAAGIADFWADARDASGQSVVPAGAQLVPTQPSDWPITSRILWDPMDPPVMSLSFDLVNADDSLVTPSQLGCDRGPITFTFGMTTTDAKANWDFGWFAGLWRTEIDELGTHVGDGGMWLGWHASSFDAIAPVNELPEILEVTDANGNPTTSVTLGSLIQVGVAHGLPAGQVEMSLGGRVITSFSTAPGSLPDETVYSFLVPTTSQVGTWSFFFRNLGATPLMNPTQVPQIQPGYDYVLLGIR